MSVWVWDSREIAGNKKASEFSFFLSLYIFSLALENDGDRVVTYDIISALIGFRVTCYRFVVLDFITMFICQ